MDYSWPGNVRELENVVERAVTLNRGEKIAPDDLPPAVQGARGDRRVSHEVAKKCCRCMRSSKSTSRRSSTRPAGRNIRPRRLWASTGKPDPQAAYGRKTHAETVVHHARRRRPSASPPLDTSTRLGAGAVLLLTTSIFCPRSRPPLGWATGCLDPDPLCVDPAILRRHRDL